MKLLSPGITDYFASKIADGGGVLPKSRFIIEKLSLKDENDLSRIQWLNLKYLALA